MPQPLFPGSAGTPFIELQSVDSTNNYARSLIRDGLAQNGTAVFAHEQTAGKGQRGKFWASEKGANILLSVLLRPQPVLLSQQFMLSATVGVAVHDFFMKYAGEGCKIKWPNDLYWQDRKAGGVLIENVVRGGQSAVGSRQSDSESSMYTSDQWQWAIIGIGINVNQVVFPPELLNPVSLKQITGKDHNVIDLTRELCGFIIKSFRKLIDEDFSGTYDRYVEHLYKRNKTVRLKKGNRVFEAMIKTVSLDGKLVVQHRIEEEFDFGEVEWVI